MGRYRLNRKEYIESLKKRHGKFFVFLIKRLATDPFLTGADIAREFGLPRERVRQICDRVYYPGFLRDRKKLAKKRAVINGCYPIKLRRGRPRTTDICDIKEKVFLEFLSRIRKVGLEATHIRNSFFRLSNGAVVSLKFSAQTERSLVRFSITKGVLESDFVIFARLCQIAGSEKFVFFVFPGEILKEKYSLKNGRETSFYLTRLNGEWKYPEFMERFDFLFLRRELKKIKT